MRVVAFFVAKQCQYKQTAQSAKMPIEEANEILLKFKREEQKIEDRLKSRQVRKLTLHNTFSFDFDFLVCTLRMVKTICSASNKTLSII